MKALACILSLYILILTAIPCNDVPPDHAAFKTELSPNSTGHHQNTTDTCTPFCVCNCCVSPISHVVYRVTLACYSNAGILFSNYTASFSSLATASIWQPPKLS
ncbi:MAG: hypothetical protein Q8904_05475 [Bacteroidota bacterium]|nr:hypothetical protein [Bacteroidota bacterium]